MGSTQSTWGPAASSRLIMPPKKKDAKGGKTDSKKSLKDFLAKTKGGAAAKKKKWSKGKVREKLNNMVIFDQGTYDRMMKEVSTFKLVSTSAISERLKVSGSLARRAIKELITAGSIKPLDTHSKQLIYTRNAGGED